MNDPFKINGLTCISFSGGRTSAYMLWRVLQSRSDRPSYAEMHRFSQQQTDMFAGMDEGIDCFCGD